MGHFKIDSYIDPDLKIDPYCNQIILYFFLLLKTINLN
jgi:hypothetical protein